MDKKQNFAYIIVILAITIILILYKNIYNSKGAVALVSAQEVSTRIPLDKDGIIDIANGLLPVQLLVDKGTISFINSQCPDHKCEGFGKLSTEGDQAICAPARVVVTVEAEQ